MSSVHCLGTWSIVYNWPRNPTNNFPLNSCLFGTFKLFKNVTKSKFIYNGQELVLIYINFSKAKAKLCLHLHYNGDESYLYVNKTEICKSKENKW